MKKSYLKIRHTEEANRVLEKRFLSESYKNMSRVILEQDDEFNGDEVMQLKWRSVLPDEVKQIQQKLGLTPNGNWNSNDQKTKDAVTKFQKENGLDETGFLNIGTYNKLETKSSSKKEDTTKVSNPKSQNNNTGASKGSDPVFGVKVLEEKGGTTPLYNIDVYGPSLQNTNVVFNYKIAGLPEVFKGVFTCNDGKISLGENNEGYYLTEGGEKLFREYCSKNPSTGYEYVSAGMPNSTTT